MCLALVFAIQKLRHYMHAYTIHLVAKADLIIYVSAKAIKGQALADFLADHPIPADWKISDNLPDEDVYRHLPNMDDVLRWICTSGRSGGRSGIHVAIKPNTTLFFPTKRIMLQQRR
ncbi:hypothetical protein ACFX10_032212 [Malus domestica]